jgi:hypothetical protein
MSDLQYLVLIIILGFLITIITSSKDLFSIKTQVLKKRFPWKGVVVIILGIGIIIASICQYFQTKTEEKNKEEYNGRQQHINDSINANKISDGIDSNRKRLFNDLSKALSKQKLQLDTVNDRIEALKDSIKNPVQKEAELTSLIINEDGITTKIQGDTLTVNIVLISTETTATIIYLKRFDEIEYSNGTFQRSQFSSFINSKVSVSKDYPFGFSFQNLHIYPFRNISSIKIALLGEYTSGQNRKKTPLKNVYVYDMKTSKTGFLDQEHSDDFFKTRSLQ